MENKKLKVGNVPNSTKNIPNLRFTIFKGEWESKKLGELLEFKNGVNASKEEYGHGIKFVNVSDILNNDFLTYDNIIGLVDINNSTLKKYSVKYGDILFQRSSETREEVGTANVYLDKEKIATFGGFVIRGKKIGNFNPIFLNNLLKTNVARNSITSRSGGSTRYNVGQETLSSVELNFPSLHEQNKIASFLLLIDEKIRTQNKIIEQLETLIRDLRNQIFKKKIRFKDEFENEFVDWGICKLRDISGRIVQKNSESNQNVLTISAQFGLISQLDYFNKSVSSKDVSGYYLLRRNDFAYNKSYSIGYPMGAIKRLLKYEIGIVSTLYICFRFNDAVDIDYIEQYFESGIQNSEIEKIAQEGARNHGLLNVGVSDFFDIEICIPTIKEQRRIASFLSKIDRKIQAEKAVLEQLERQKKYLLHQMFV